MKKFLTFLMLLVASVSFAQQPVQKYWYINGDYGFSIYHGDLANYTGWCVPEFSNNPNFNKDYFMKNFDAKLTVGRNAGKWFGYDLTLGAGSLSGYNYIQPLSLQNVDGVHYGLALDHTTYYSAALNANFNIFNMFNYNPERVFNIIPHIGVGYMCYGAGSVSEMGTENRLADRQDWQHTWFVPVGGELNFNCGRKIDVFIDYTYNFAGSDNIDQVKKYPKDDVQYVNDMWSQLNLGVRYKFNNYDPIKWMTDNNNQVKMWTDPDPLVERDSIVEFDFYVEYPANYFYKKAINVIEPTVYLHDESINLESIAFCGEKVNPICAGCEVVPMEGGTYKFHYSFPYAPRYDENNELIDANGHLNAIIRFSSENSDREYAGDDRIVTDRVIATSVPVIPEPEPVVEVLEVIPTPIAVFYFDKNVYKKLSDTDVNAASTQVMDNMLEGDYKLIGFASPEGAEDHNMTLSENRAKKIASMYSNLNAEIESRGEDWDNMISIIRMSNMKDSESIANVLENATDKETELRNLMEVYPDFEENVFPFLRRCEVWSK